MKNFRTNITKRRIRQKNREGKVFVYDRYILNYNDPATGKRRMERFDTRKAAEAAQNELIKNHRDIARRRAEPPTMAEAVQYWLKSRHGNVSAHTYKSYEQVTRDWIIGPALCGTPSQRRDFGMTGKMPVGTTLVPLFGPDVKIDELRTADIRAWCLQVKELSTTYVAKVARKSLSSIFKLIEEDFDVRLARMPSRVGPAHRRKRRTLLTQDQTSLVLREAQQDKKWGVYYAFAFLTGTRPNEQLGLLWEDLDLERGRARIHRSQQPDGSLKPFTKTDAGMREVPLNSMLLEMLREWQTRCPRLNGRLYRVFPAQAHEKFIGRQATEQSDGGLSLNNYRNRVWYPMLERLGLPKIPPYAARHMMISFLQAEGVEVGQVAKIAGHANPQITLQYYTHAVRERDGVMDALSNAYKVDKMVAAKVTGVQIP